MTLSDLLGLLSDVALKYFNYDGIF